MEESSTHSEHKKYSVWRGLIVCFVAVIFGFAAGIVVLWELPQQNLSWNNPYYQKVGIRKPQIIGFQPYWLLSKTPTNYSDFLTNTTYFGLVMNGDGTIQKQVNAKEEEPGWTGLRGQKLKDRLQQDLQHTLSTSLLIHSSSNTAITTLVQNPEGNAKNLLAAVTPIMKDNQFTDLNLDFESYSNASPEARLAMNRFVKTVKKGLQENNLGTLTVELTPSSLINTLILDPQAMGEIADRVILMAYDFHYTGSQIAGPVAPIGGAGETREYDVETSLQEALKVIPKEKVFLGIPLYGYEWETLSREPGSPTIPGTGKTATSARAEELKTSCSDCVAGVDRTSQEPYLILPPNEESNIQQIYYEDAATMEKKIALAKKYYLGGIALWALGYEDDSILQPLATYKNSYYWHDFPGGKTSYWARYFPQ